MASATYTGAAPPSRPEHRERELSDSRCAELADDFARRMGARGEALARDASGAESRRPAASTSGVERASVERARAVESGAGRALPGGLDRVDGAAAFGTAFRGSARGCSGGASDGEAIGGRRAGPSGEPIVRGREAAENEPRGAADAERTFPRACDDPLGESLDDGTLEAEHALVEAVRDEEALECTEEIEADGDQDEHEGSGAAVVAGAVAETVASSEPIGAGSDGGGEGGEGGRTGEFVQDLAERLVERLDELALADAANVDGLGDGSGEGSDVWRFTLEHDAEALDFAVTRRATGELAVALGDTDAEGALAELAERLAAIDPGIVLERVEQEW